MSARLVNSPHPGRTMTVAAVLAVTAFAAPSAAMADRGHRGHGHGHGGGPFWQGGHGGPRLNIHLGAPVYRPHYYVPPSVYYAPPPVYYAPRVIYSAPLSYAPALAYVPPVVYSTRSPAVVYVERNDLGAAAPAPAPSADTAFWFFCTDSNTYYPYVTQCATPWERVVPSPPSAGR